MKWIAMGLCVLLIAGFLHRMRMAHHERWLDFDA